VTSSDESFLTPGSGVRLESWFAPGTGAGAVVAPPHPVYGGVMSNHVVVAAVHGFIDAGMAGMAFNYRGTGASEGRVTDDPEAAAADYTGALDALATRVPGPYVAAGYSFGAATASAVAGVDDRVSGAVLIAPPVDMIRAEVLAGFTRPLLVIVGDGDAYAPLDRLTALLADRSDTALEVVQGADHFFGFHGAAAITTLVARHVAKWF
jgi:alpha/beta superfamily hydrolase